MCLQIFWLCICTALDQQQTRSKENEWRDALMRLFFRDISESGRREAGIDVVHDFTNGCYGVKCVDGEVTEVEYRFFNFGNFNIEALPNSTKILVLEDSGQLFPIQTRSFPKKLRMINLNSNQIYGFLDLTVLPQNLEVALFENNRMTGRISLMKLPESLKRLGLRMNNISQETVWYDNFPDGLLRVVLVPQRGVNGIQEVRAVESKRAVIDKDVFKWMDPSKVH